MNECMNKELNECGFRSLLWTYKVNWTRKHLDDSYMRMRHCTADTEFEIRTPKVWDIAHIKSVKTYHNMYVIAIKIRLDIWVGPTKLSFLNNIVNHFVSLCLATATHNVKEVTIPHICLIIYQSFQNLDV